MFSTQRQGGPKGRRPGGALPAATLREYLTLDTPYWRPGRRPPSDGWEGCRFSIRAVFRCSRQRCGVQLSPNTSRKKGIPDYMKVHSPNHNCDPNDDRGCE